MTCRALQINRVVGEPEVERGSQAAAAGHGFHLFQHRIPVDSKDSLLSFSLNLDVDGNCRNAKFGQHDRTQHGTEQVTFIQFAELSLLLQLDGFLARFNLFRRWDGFREFVRC